MKAPHPFDQTIRTALYWTVPWALVLFVVLVLSALKKRASFVPTFTYPSYLSVVWLVGPVLVGLILYGVFRATRYIPMGSATSGMGPWYGDGFLVALLIFWALAPPSYFFVEYYAFDQQLIQCWNHVEASKKQKAPCLDDIKIYGELASKFWAGGGAVLLALTALAKSAGPGIAEVDGARAATASDWRD